MSDKEFETIITQEIFYKKELCDVIRDIVLNSACDLKTAMKLMQVSTDYTRDSFIAKKLINCGMGVSTVASIIIALNDE